MDTADPRIDYLGGTDGTRNDQLHGVVTLKSKEEPSLSNERGFFCYTYELVAFYSPTRLSLLSETNKLLIMGKQTIQFDMELFQGYTCIGCAVINDLVIEVEFTDDEIAQMKQLVSQLDETLYSQGIMPVLKDGAPELYDRMEEAARNEIFDFLVEDGIRQNYVEFEEDELRANFRKDFGIDDDEEIDEDGYNEWYDEEMDRIRCSGLAWIRARYSVDDQVCLDELPDYTVDIPSDFLS